MSRVGMICPHCQEDQVFEAQEPILVKLSFDDWKVSSVASQVPKEAIWTCLGCGEWVGIDFMNKLMLKRSRPVPIFDSVVQGILEFAKDQEGNEIARESTIKALADKNYQGLSFLATWKKIVSIILEQRP